MMWYNSFFTFIGAVACAILVAYLIIRAIGFNFSNSLGTSPDRERPAMSGMLPQKPTPTPRPDDEDISIYKGKPIYKRGSKVCFLIEDSAMVRCASMYQGTVLGIFIMDEQGNDIFYGIKDNNSGECYRIHYSIVFPDILTTNK